MITAASSGPVSVTMRTFSHCWTDIDTVVTDTVD